jgi:2-dehydro-3-deoxygalactonokinase
LIAVDWGTSNFRAYRLDGVGAMVARRSSPQGILRVTAGNFEHALRAEIGDWLAAGETQVLLCGMVGSRQGWVETKYLPCPAGVADLTAALQAVPFPDARVSLVPGVMGSDSAGVPEVMRGEETAAMGILDACGGEALVCFPGTHSKWLQLSDRRICRFTTFMTGEMYSAVRNGTILGRMMAGEVSAAGAAFLAGVARAGQESGLLHHLFGVRTLGLMGRLGEEDAASYLSGLLIGHEVRAAMQGQAVVHLVGTAALCSLYAQAIHACGGEAKIGNEDAAALGLAAIGRRVHWI